MKLTEAEWIKGVEFLTRVGQFCTETRQEFILLSDVLGLEMTVVELNHGTDAGETEATLLGPFYVPDAPELPKAPWSAATRRVSLWMSWARLRTKKASRLSTR